MVDANALSEHINSMLMENGGDIETILRSRLVTETLASTQMSVLSLACQICNVRLVRSLLEQGVDVNVKGADGMSPLHILCNSEKHQHARLKIAELLLQHKADVNQQDSLGRTPLHLACYNNQASLVNLLTQAGCDVNLQDVNGDTPFSVTCRVASNGWYFWNTDSLNNDDDENEESSLRDFKFPPVVICRTLLRAGADPKQATLLPSAVMLSTMDLVKEFVDLGMDVNQMDENRRSSLGSACSASHIPLSMVKLLLERGADVNEDNGGRKGKPIVLAYVHNSVDKMCLLLSYGATVSHDEMSELVSISLTKWFIENPLVINESSKELLPLKLLLKAGFHPRVSLLAPKLKKMSLCSSYNQISPWINNLLSPVLSLSDICRIKIRSQLRPSIDDKIDQLPLPNSLKEYLKFNEFIIPVFRRYSVK